MKTGCAGSQSRTCNNCHEGGKWTALKFDHGKSNYPLKATIKRPEVQGYNPRAATSRRPNMLRADAVSQRTTRTSGPGAQVPKPATDHRRTRFDHNDPKVPVLASGGQAPGVRCQAATQQRYKPAPTICRPGCHADPTPTAGAWHRCAGCRSLRAGRRSAPAATSSHALWRAHDRVRCSVPRRRTNVAARTRRRCAWSATSATASIRDLARAAVQALPPRQRTFVAARFNLRSRRLHCLTGVTACCRASTATRQQLHRGVGGLASPAIAMTRSASRRCKPAGARTTRSRPAAAVMT